ncbi:hypothetical protein EWM64_g3465 [Hericium alpestre]|uniref:Uncharacterized protein n=1 Tax=Hericium alpestre TaxID=135208 RepID=A0A4Z0A099_9AGAM|nr:hypothetical protein EWM64_g3465 [Hericium alpestre]
MSNSPAGTPRNEPTTPTKWLPSQSPQIPMQGQQLVDAEIAALEQSDLFLGSEGLMDLVKWREEGRRERLVLKSQDDENDEENPSEEAVCQIIGKISADEAFWMDPSGGWTGRYGDLYQSKASCQVVTPAPTLSDHWQKVLDRTISLMQDRRMKQAEIQNSIITQSQGLHIRHSVFDAVDYNTYKTRTDEIFKKDKRLLMSNWACGSTKAQKELNSLVWHNSEDKPNTTRYFGNPIPIFYHDKSRLLPSDPQYSEKLRGAVVKIGLSITHEFMSRQPPVNDFYADIRYIIILKKPPPPPKAPLKRSLDFPDVAAANTASSASSSSKRTRA